MRKYDEIKHTYQRVLKFLLNDIWHLDLSELGIMRARLIRYLKVLIITVRGFARDKIALQAASLSFFSAMSVVPIITLVFVITNGFGLEEKLRDIIFKSFEGNKEIVEKIIDISGNIIKTSQNGFFGAISFIFLLWTIVWLMLSVERSFNEIWRVSSARALGKRVAYYFALLLGSPMVIIVFLTLSFYYSNALYQFGVNIDKYFPITSLFSWIIAYCIVVLVFTVMYKYIPNTKVKLSAAFNSALILAFAFIVVQFLYLETQIMVVGLNAIYGVFAAIPLFLIWMNISWTLILFGAELSHAYQNVDCYKLDDFNFKL